MASYLKAHEKWKGLSKEIGRDVNKMRDALMREVYDKFDYAKILSSSRIGAAGQASAASGAKCMAKGGIWLTQRIRPAAASRLEDPINILVVDRYASRVS